MSTVREANGSTDNGEIKLLEPTCPLVPCSMKAAAPPHSVCNDLRRLLAALTACKSKEALAVHWRGSR